MDIFYEKPGFVKCWYDPKLKLIVEEFEQFTADVDEFKRQHDDCFPLLETAFLLLKPGQICDKMEQILRGKRAAFQPFLWFA